MSAKSVRNTPRTAAMLRRLEAIWITQSGAPASSERSQCFATNEDLVDKLAGHLR